MHHRIRPIRTAAVALSTAALGVGVLAAPPASAEPSPALRAAKAAAATDSTPSTIAAEWISDEGALSEAVDRAIAANPDVAAKIRDGKVAAAGALIGAVMKEMRGQADAGRVRELILQKLS